MADHKIEVNINAVDGASGIISKVKSNIDSLMRKIKSVAGVKVSGDGLRDIGNGANHSKDQVDALNSSLARIRNTVVGAFSISAIVDFGKSCLQASADMELLRKGLEFSLGVSQTEQLIKNIQTIGEESAYDSNDLVSMARQWVNIGDNAETATKKISTIVDAGSAFGLTTQQIQGANLALTQMQMNGKIGQQDMMQLLNAGIPAWQLLSEKMGVPVEELKDMSSHGELTQEALSNLFDAIGEKTKGTTASMNNTLSAAFSNMGEVAHNTLASIGDIISQAFDVKGIAGEFSDFFGKFRQDLEYIKALSGSMGLRKAFEEEYGPIAKVIELLGDLAAAYAAIKAAQLACAAAQAAFNAVTNANPLVLALTVTIGLLILAYQHIDELKEIWGQATEFASQKLQELGGWVDGIGQRIQAAFSEAFNAVVNKFNSIINTLKSGWSDFVNFVSHPIDSTINVVRNVTEKISSQRSGANGYAKGGLFGMARGGVVGGLVPLANGGTLKHGTPAIVGEAGPEAVIPLKKDVLASIGAGIAEAYKNGLNGASKSSEIQAKIKAEIDPGSTSEVSKILDDTRRKAKDIGEQLKAFHEYEQKATEDAKKYAETGSATLEFKQKEAELQKKIHDLQNTKKPDNVSTQRLANAQNELEELRTRYANEKEEAIAAAQDVANNREAIEKAAADTLVAINKEAVNKITSYSRAKNEAENASRRAQEAQTLEEYQSIMNAKDEITNESYASLLAHEDQLGEQRQIWHDQLMLNTATWSDYMNTLMLQVGQNLQTNIADGLTSIIMQSKSIFEVVEDIAKKILQEVINGVLKKWIASIGIIKNLNDANGKKEVASIVSQTAALHAKAAAEAKVAAAAMIAALPFSAYTAGATVASQMAVASAGAVKMASGGAVLGAGTSTSDSIPAMLSNGEYVINADAAARIGRSTLNALNQGKYPALAEGGAVGTAVNGNQPGRAVSFNISAMDASSFTDFLRNGGGDAIKQMLFDNDRDFTAAAGVW